MTPWSATWPQGTGTSLLITSADFSSGSIHPKTASTFTNSTTPSTLMSETGSFAVNSDGTGQWPKNIQAGIDSCTPTTSQVVASKRINFAYSFPGIPSVTVSAFTQRPDIVFASPAAIDATGFTVYVYRGNGTTPVDFEYVAMMPTV